MGRFTVLEITAIAVKIEENGRLLYENAAKTSPSPEQTVLLRKLADEETGHRATFSNMLTSLSGRHASIEFPGDKSLYISAVADAVAFTPAEAEELVLKLTESGTNGVLEFAQERERETINFYQSVLGFLPRKDRVHIRGIIEEEERHFAILEGLKGK